MVSIVSTNISNQFNNKVDLNASSKEISPPFPQIKKVVENFVGYLDNISLKFNNLTNKSKNNISFVENNNNNNLISKNTKVLIIGDSQTVGNYGATLDNLVRSTNAKVVTMASWGSSPESWFKGSVTNKAWIKESNGKETRPENCKTPLIEDVLKKEKPDIVIVTMGGNMITNATQKSVSSQVDKIGTAISNSGAKLFWAGPPKYDPAKRTPEQLDTFYSYLAKSVSTYGVLIDSRKFINEYHGTDGLHYSGTEGKKETVKWANGVFKEIQNSKINIK